LGCSRDDEGADVRCRSGDRRGGGEASQPGEESALAAEDVGQSAAQGQEAAEGKHIRGEDPLPIRVGEPEVGLRRREGNVHDGGVKQDHDLRDQDDGEDEPAARVMRVFRRWRRDLPLGRRSPGGR
jgi:hypothetical protein